MTEKEKKFQDIINGIETSEETKIRKEILESIEFSETHWINIYKEERRKQKKSSDKLKNIALSL